MSAVSPRGIPLRQESNPNVAQGNLLGPAAAAAVTRCYPLVAPRKGEVRAVKVVPRTTVAQDAGDPTTFRLKVGADTVGSTTNAAGALTAGTAYSLTITEANRLFDEGDVLVFEVENLGAGAQNLSSTYLDVQVDWQPA